MPPAMRGGDVPNHSLIPQPEPHQVLPQAAPGPSPAPVYGLIWGFRVPSASSSGVAMGPGGESGQRELCCGGTRELIRDVSPHGLAHSCPHRQVFVHGTGAGGLSRCGDGERSALSGRGRRHRISPSYLLHGLPAPWRALPDVPWSTHCFPNEIFMQSFCLLTEKPLRLPHHGE